MIRKVTVSNFLCLQEVAVELRPLTVLIGKNNTGKSTFLEGMEKLGPSWQWTSKQQSLTFQERGGSVRITREPDQSNLRIQRFTLPATGPTITSHGVADRGAAPDLAGNGSNVAAMVDWMLRRDRDRFFQLVDAIRDRIPGTSDVQVATPDAARRGLDLIVEQGWTVDADRLSAGARLTLFFLTLAWHPSPPDVVLVEEPENGVHPGRLHDIMGLLRGLVTGAHGPRPVQVVLSTHSPLLLDDVRIPEDQVLVFERNAHGACTARPLDPTRVEPFLRDFGLGEIWLNDGEARLVGQGG